MVAIPSNRVSDSDCFGQCNWLPARESQSPLIGSVIQIKLEEEERLAQIKSQSPLIGSVIQIEGYVHRSRQSA